MKRLLYIIILLPFFLPGCKKYYVNGVNLPIPDWTEETHGKTVAPNYDIVFKEGVVNRFDIKISSDDWTDMQADLNANVRAGNPAPPINSSWEPMYVPCSYFFNDREWYKVGIRYKGNSSLRVCVANNLKKYSFRISFDHFEDEWTPIKNQRFYGFKGFSLTNGFSDPSMMREKTTTDLFREFGIEAPHAVFCELWVDYGLGPKYFGLYTIEEEVDDTVIKTQFSDGGNLYKPEGMAATFANGTYNITQFYKQTNPDQADYSDVRSLYDIINGESRIINYNSWKSALEGVLDVPHFLKWLAANTVIQNWDTYGKSSHNYYLYNVPGSGRLTWIPWDNNEALSPGKQGGALSLSLDEVTEGWPLIRYLMDDTGYREMYRTYVSEFVQAPFSVASFQARIDNQASLIRQYVENEVAGYTFQTSPAQFEQGVLDLKQHVLNRADAVTLFLAK
jgi:spore coat protein H